MSHSPSLPPRLIATALLAASALAGCATTQPKAPDVQWPFPPEKPRIRFVRAFSREDDLRAGGLQTAMRLFVPNSPEAAVQQPTGLALSPDGAYLYVSCASIPRVLRVDLLQGKVETVAKEEGKRPGSPFGVAVDGEGSYYLTDMVNHSVWVYAADGRFLRKFAVGDKPTGIAVDPRRQLVYVVVGVTQRTDHRIEVYSTQGEKLRTLGTRGAGPGQFNFPTNLAVGPDGNLYVVDMLNFRIQVFDPDGQLVSMFGMPGAGEPGTFDKAKGIALDAFGNVYVTDSQQGTVQLFNPRFHPLMAFAGRANAPGYMLLPTAIAIDAKNTIYVADYAAGAVNEYQLVNTVAGDSFLSPAEASGRSSPAATP
jgi:DNA-binding beta-propeller fold protein YncE